MTQTPSPDIQQRETIARIIDHEGYWDRLDNLNAVIRAGIAPSDDVHMELCYKRDEERAGTEESLAKADAILALRSNPQPGSEGGGAQYPDAEIKKYPALLAYIQQLARSDMNMPHQDWAALLNEIGNALQLAASPTPPTAQPGEVERLRSDIERLEAAIRWALGEGDSDFGDKVLAARKPGPFWWRTELRARAALTPSESGEAGNV